MSSVQPRIVMSEEHFDPARQGHNAEENSSLVDENYLYRNLIFFSILLCILLSLIIFCLIVTNWQIIGWPGRDVQEEQKMEGLRRKHVRRALTMTTIEQWQNPNGYYHQSTCVICLEDFQAGEPVRKLNCKHVFHLHCIDNWVLKMTAACPICKQRLVKHQQVRAPDPAGESESDDGAGTMDVDLTPRVRMNPRGEASPVLLFAIPSTPPQPITARESPPPRPRDVLVEYFQSPEDAELGRGGRREIVLEFPIVQVSPIPIPVSSES